MGKVKCQKCGHEWNTKSKCMLVTCSSCGFKTKNRIKSYNKKPVNTSLILNPKQEDQTNGKPNQSGS